MIDSRPPSTPSAAPGEVKVALPVRSLLAWMIFAILLVTGAWAAAVAAGFGGPHGFKSGLYGIGVAAVFAVSGLLIMTPWKKRAIADWMTMWLAGTVFRVLGTPTAAFVLYSALSPGLAAKPFGLAVALTYIATLFVEAAVIAKHMKALIDSPGRARG